MKISCILVFVFSIEVKNGFLSKNLPVLYSSSQVKSMTFASNLLVGQNLVLLILIAFALTSLFR